MLRRQEETQVRGGGKVRGEPTYGANVDKSTLVRASNTSWLDASNGIR